MLYNVYSWLSKKNLNFLYTLCQHTLELVPDNPYLGVQISSDLKWSKHINKISNKASSVLGFLRRNLKHCPKECKKIAYTSLVRSILEYGSIVWDPFLQKGIDASEKVQRRAPRFIINDYTTRTPGFITGALTDLGLPDLVTRRAYNRLSFLYKISEGLVPAIGQNVYLTKTPNKRKIKAKTFSGCISNNFVCKNERNNNKCFNTLNCSTPQYKNSFFCENCMWLELSTWQYCPIRNSRHLQKEIVNWHILVIYSARTLPEDLMPVKDSPLYLFRFRFMSSIC